MKNMNQTGFVNSFVIIGIAILVVIALYLPVNESALLLPPASTSTFSPNPTLSPSPPYLEEPGLAICANLQQRINGELLKANYCSSDSDCSSENVLQRGEDGEHRCGDGLPNYYHNNNADTEVLKQLGQQYAANQCPAAPPGGCMGPREDQITKIACVQNRCVLTFPAK